MGHDPPRWPITVEAKCGTLSKSRGELKRISVNRKRRLVGVVGPLYPSVVEAGIIGFAHIALIVRKQTFRSIRLFTYLWEHRYLRQFRTFVKVTKGSDTIMYVGQLNYCSSWISLPVIKWKPGTVTALPTPSWSPNWKMNCFLTTNIKNFFLLGPLSRWRWFPFEARLIWFSQCHISPSILFLIIKKHCELHFFPNF